MRNRFLLACVILSGFSGLAYELLWTRLLAFSFGSTTLSFSTVLAVFFGGLALGAWLAGKRSVTLARPVQAYAIVELVTGLAGLGLYPILTHLDRVFAALDPGPGLGGAVARLLVAAPLLFVPTVLMGATLPILCAAMIERDDEVGHGTALIYGFNTLGAFLGVYLTTYHILPAAGVFRALVVTALVNIAVAIIAFTASRRGADRPRERLAEPALTDLSARAEPDRRAQAAEDASAQAERHKMLIVATVLTGLGGFSAICLQVVWVRLFSVFLEGTVYALGSVLVSVLIGIAIGSIVIARILQRSANAALWFAGLQVLTIASVIAMTRALDWINYQLRSFAWYPTGGSGAIHLQLAGVFVVLLVPTFCSGASFPLLVNVVEKKAREVGRRVGGLYAANTIGSILGSLLTGFFLIPSAGSEATVLTALTLTAAVAALGATILIPRGRRAPGLAVAAVALALIWTYEGFDLRRLSTAVPGKLVFRDYREQQATSARQLAFFAEGSTGNISLFEVEAQRTLALNGLGQGSYSSLPPHYVLESLLVGLVPFAHVAEPKNALVVGLGAGGTVDLLRKLGMSKIKVVELEPRVADAVDRIFGDETPLRSSQVELIFNDARHYLLLDARLKRGKYDLITSMPAHPWVASPIFTREFFDLARENLSEEGVFCLWFGLGKMDDQAVQSLLRAFAAAFPSYVVYWVPEAGAYYLVGAGHQINIDIEQIERLRAHPDVSDHTPVQDPYFLPARVYASGSPDTPQPPTGVINTDDSAFVEVHAPRSSTRSPVLSDFMPSEYLLPAFIPEARRHDFYVELLEELVATPKGEIPLAPAPLYIDRAKKTLDGAKAFLSADEQLYFEGRILLAQNKRPEAMRLLAKVGATPARSESTAWLGRRARKFAALCEKPRSNALLEALAKLDPSTDVLIKILDFDRARALARVPAVAIDPVLDPIGWFLQKASSANTAELSEEDRTIFATRVGPSLSRAQSVGLLSLCQDFAVAHGLERRAPACRDWELARRRAKAAPLLEQGRAAGARGDFRLAAERLGEANIEAPGNRTVMTLLLRSLVEIGDEAGIDALIGEYQFQGASERFIQALLDQARSRKLGKQQLEERPPTPAPDLTMGPPPTGAPAEPGTATQVPAPE